MDIYPTKNRIAADKLKDLLKNVYQIQAEKCFIKD